MVEEAGGTGGMHMTREGNAKNNWHNKEIEIHRRGGDCDS
jgi:hypothetical protein